ncbi:hypothetical protein GN956_G11764 [Arapaima gigas]
MAGLWISKAAFPVTGSAAFAATFLFVTRLLVHFPDGNSTTVALGSPTQLINGHKRRFRGLPVEELLAELQVQAPAAACATAAMSHTRLKKETVSGACVGRFPV